MPTPLFEDEDSPPIDPDDVSSLRDEWKMPESPQHRRASDVIGLVAAKLLGDEVEVFRDMNWYPTDGGTAMAPDVMVLQAGVWTHPPGTDPTEQLKSYRQDLIGGPSPLVAVEVPSNSDGFTAVFGKAIRYRELGTEAYVVTCIEPYTVLRLTPSTTDWGDRPIPELGGIRLARAHLRQRARWPHRRPPRRHSGRQRLGTAGADRGSAGRSGHGGCRGDEPSRTVGPPAPGAGARARRLTVRMESVVAALHGIERS